jgi:hypothetical protein
MSEITDETQPPRSRAGWYALVVIVAVLGAAYYHLRTDSIFGCQATGYSSERFLSYCQTDGYGDYDHGAFWFDLEPEASRAAASAQLLFVGNSRMQYGFSSLTSRQWLLENASPYYLLGFAYHPRVLFERALLKRIAPHPRAYVINLDTFFEENASVPARTVMNDPKAQSHYRQKQYWQYLHRAVCQNLVSLCGNSYGIFKDRRTGTWQTYGAISANEAVSVDSSVDAKMIEREVASGRQFLSELGVDPRCIIFTLVPTVDAPFAASAAIANQLHVDFIAPQPDDLLTFDGSHLDHESAERWSGEFFDAAGPRLRQCLSNSNH